MSAELIYALEQLEKEKGISKEVIVEAIEAALITAYKRNYGSALSVEVYIDRETGDVRVFALKNIVEEVTDPSAELSLEQANQFGADFEIGDVVEVEVTPRKFGRIAAQTAKQVVMQRIREAERSIIFDEFSNREEDIVTGVISRFDRKNVIVDLGRAEAILPPGEQTPGEKYNIHDRIKAYVINVKKTSKSPQIFISRTHPGLVKRLLELEVPEIHDGTVEIKTIAREAGSRTKIAIYSKNENVDPVGACVGQKGSRIRAIVEELKGEMLDVIKWNSSPQEYIASSLSPAKVVRVDIDEINKVARVIVPDFQLSLAIGKEGQNARLAAKLTGWKIDIKSESQLRAQIEQQLLNYNAEQEENEYDEEEDNRPESLFIDDTEPSADYEEAEITEEPEALEASGQSEAIEASEEPDPVEESAEAEATEASEQPEQTEATESPKKPKRRKSLKKTEASEEPDPVEASTEAEESSGAEATGGAEATEATEASESPKKPRRRKSSKKTEASEEPDPVEASTEAEESSGAEATGGAEATEATEASESPKKPRRRKSSKKTETSVESEDDEDKKEE